MNECLNSLPIEQGAWTRRPGTRFAKTTRRGTVGRVIQFDFNQAAPYTLEFTDAVVRFRSGPNLVTTQDDKTITAISAATPAVVQTSAAHGWATGNTVQFPNLGTFTPLLQNRLFSITVIDSTHFSLQDEITAANIDGSTLGTLISPMTVQRILELASPYTGTLWRDVRLVQAELTAVLLHPRVAPYVLTATAPTVGQTYYTFTLAPANFIDGPYLDPPTNGVLITPGGSSGIVTMTLSFPAWSAGLAYSIGDFVTFGGAVNYRSLTNQNQGNQPNISPTNWETVSAGLAIGPNGFLTSDIGRLIRLFASNSIWSAGKIVSVANLIDPALAGSVRFGNLTQGGGLFAAFDGVLTQAAAQSAELVFVNNDPALGQVGKSFTAGPQIIGSATMWMPSDLGPVNNVFKTYTTSTTTYRFDGSNWIVTSGPTGQAITVPTIATAVTIQLRASQTLPASINDGTQLAIASYVGGNPYTLVSTDQVTAWNFVWFEIVVQGIISTVPDPIDTRNRSTTPTVGETAVSQSSVFNSNTVTIGVAEAQFFNPPGSAVGNAITVQLFNSLPNAQTMSIWQLGAYSNTTGWPACGTYHEGRLWLSGAIPNRVDASMSNKPFKFSPSELNGQIPDNEGITATFNAPDVNAIFWMIPDQQGIIVGTQAGPWLVQASANNNPLTPGSMQAHRYSRFGCANIEPRIVDRVVIFVQRFRRKLYEYFADVFSGKFAAQNITWAMQNLSKPGIAEIAVQQELAPIIWARCDDGSLFGITYKRESMASAQPPNFAGGHRHVLGSGRTVESIAVGPSVDGTLDSLSMVTNDSTSGIRHVEILESLFEENSQTVNAWFLDDAVAPTSTTSSNVTPAPYGGLTLNGLWHLNARTVTVFAGGLDCGEWQVINGSVTVTYGDGVSGGTASGLFTASFVASFTAGIPIVVGFSPTSRGQMVRPVTPQESGARNGPALGKKRRTHQIAALLDMTGPISFGTSFTKMKPAIYRNDAGTILPTGTMFSDIYWTTLVDSTSYDSMICWEVTRPYPATVTAIEPFLQTQDK